MVAPVFYDKNVSVLPPIVIDSGASGPLVLKAGVAGLTSKLYRLILLCGGTTFIIFKDGTTELTGPFSFTTGGGMILDFQQDPWFQTSPGNDFILYSSASVPVAGAAWIVQS